MKNIKLIIPKQVRNRIKIKEKNKNKIKIHVKIVKDFWTKISISLNVFKVKFNKQPQLNSMNLNKLKTNDNQLIKL